MEAFVPSFFRGILGRVACSRLSLVGYERKGELEKKTREDLSLPGFFLSIALYFSLVPNYWEPGSGYGSRNAFRPIASERNILKEGFPTALKVFVFAL